MPIYTEPDPWHVLHLKLLLSLKHLHFVEISEFTFVFKGAELAENKQEGNGISHLFL
jgi:hypothetical protein